MSDPRSARKDLDEHWRGLKQEPVIKSKSLRRSHLWKSSQIVTGDPEESAKVIDEPEVSRDDPDEDARIIDEPEIGRGDQDKLAKGDDRVDMFDSSCPLAKNQDGESKTPMTADSTLSGSFGIEAPAWNENAMDNEEKTVGTLRSADANASSDMVWDWTRHFTSVGMVKEMVVFREFLKPRYTMPVKAFDEFKGLAERLDKKRFLVCLEDLQYTGNSDRLFKALSGGNDFLERNAFRECLVAVSHVQLPKKKRITFGHVVLHAVQSKKGDNDNDWVALPPAIIALDGDKQGPMPTGLDFFQVLDFSIQREDGILASASDLWSTSRQPEASGQPEKRSWTK
jgi:hypothetical protein